MALSRRTGTRFQASIWPGFVDAMTGLLLVLMFVLTIFMVVQFVLRETITGQETKLDALSAEVAALANALGLEQDRSTALTERVGELTATLGDAQTREQQQNALIAALRSERDAQDAALTQAQARIVSFEDQVAGLLSQRNTAVEQITTLEDARDTLLSEREQLQLALAGLRDEIDDQTEIARLAAARREALEALITDLRRRYEEGEDAQTALNAQVSELETRLSEEEQTRLVEAAAAEALREKLKNSEAELTSMTLALEEQRRKAEETLTMLAATEDARADLDLKLAAALLAGDTANAQLKDLLAAAEVAREEQLTAEQVRQELAAALAAKLAAEDQTRALMTEAEQRAILLAQAETELSERTGLADAAEKQQALLSRQLVALREQLSQLQAVLDATETDKADAEVQLATLGNELNTALARVAAEAKRRMELEAEARQRLEEEKQDLEKYRSEFFGQLRDVLGTQEGVRIVGDRFVFSSEVLFPPGQADLSQAGQRELAKVVGILRNVADLIPSEIDWVIQIDGHTDDVPVVDGAQFADNWDLSQARALSVLRYMINFLDMPPARLSANGFGQYQPINPDDTPEARAQNRRIELKFTEK